MHDRGTKTREFVGNSCAGCMNRGLSQQHRQVRFDAVCKAIDVVAALQNADQSSAALRIRHLQHKFSEALEIFRFQSQGSYRIIGMRIKASAYDHKVRLDPVGGSSQHVFKGGQIILARDSEFQRQIKCRSQSVAASGF